MLNTTVSKLKCPRRKRGKVPCSGSLQLFPKAKINAAHAPDVFEVTSGHLQCVECRSKFPILAGVALLVENVRDYFLNHVKGIAQVVPNSEIPPEYLSDYLEAKSEIQVEHIEEDLEAERVISLYIMNHYLRVQTKDSPSSWWKPQSGQGSPLIDELIRKYWDHGPFAQIEKWVAQLKKETRISSDVIELGCGVGGLFPLLQPLIRSYLGVDSSFASVAVGRHLALGVPYRGQIRIPSDLLQGPVSRKIHIPTATPFDGKGDLIVGDLDALPVQSEKWNLSIALNAIDMMDDPSVLPKNQYNLLTIGGVAIQSCPYIWHPGVANQLKKKLPPKLRDSSAQAVEYLYQKAGLKIEMRAQDIPWLFYKHVRQLEIYSVHAFAAKKI